MARFHMTLPLGPGAVYPPDARDGGSSLQLSPSVASTPVGQTLVLSHPVTGVPVLFVALTDDDVHPGRRPRFGLPGDQIRGVPLEESGVECLPWCRNQRKSTLWSDGSWFPRP